MRSPKHVAIGPAAIVACGIVGGTPGVSDAQSQYAQYSFVGQVTAATGVFAKTTPNGTEVTGLYSYNYASADPSISGGVPGTSPWLRQVAYSRLGMVFDQSATVGSFTYYTAGEADFAGSSISGRGELGDGFKEFYAHESSDCRLVPRCGESEMHLYGPLDHSTYSEDGFPVFEGTFVCPTDDGSPCDFGYFQIWSRDHLTSSRITYIITKLTRLPDMK